MGLWQKTGCVLCAQNCGLEVQVENNQIIKVRPDKDNPRSRGYACRKGINIANHQHHEDRLKYPLKKTADGFVRISWEQAFSEIGTKLKEIMGKYGPKSYAYMGGGGQACHFEAAFGLTLMKCLGSKYHYNALAQELTGYFWGCGRMTGRQNHFHIPDEEHSDMILAIGWNGMVSHQMPRAPIVLKSFSQDPDKILAVIDPRKSETAMIANIHIPLKPGTDALLARAMNAIILQEGWENKEYIKKNVKGFDKIKPLFINFNVKEALEICEVGYQEVKNLCLELSRRKWCMHFDLGVYMNRHSTLTSYLYMVLGAICGRVCVPGGNVIPGSLVPIGSHTDERNPKTLRTQTTNFPALAGAFPPNVLPEEILSDHPEKIRAVIVSSSNPLRSYSDTNAYEKAFGKLELLVTIELAMTETAEMSHYVLPSRSGYESWDASFFTWNYPEIYFQMRRPVVEPEIETKEAGEILTGIAEAAGIIPELPEFLYEAAKKGRINFASAFFSYALQNPKALKIAPFIISKTLGKELKSGNLAALWGLLLTTPKKVVKNAQRIGFNQPGIIENLFNFSLLFKAVSGILQYKSPAPLAIMAPKVEWTEMMFEEVLKNPQGLWIGKMDFEGNMKEVKTDSRKIDIYIPEMEKWIAEITPEAEKQALAPDPNFPLILNAGRHKPENANTLMRKPDWNQGRRACTLAMHPDDASALSLKDGEIVRIITAADKAEIELEITDSARKGQVLIPHGFGLKYKGVEFGVNVNCLTKNSHRDRFAGTPLHRYVPCRVEKQGLKS